jgi:hypothetical protein
MVSLVVAILDELKGLEVGTWDIEALEKEGSGFDAANYRIAGDGSGLRCSRLAQTFLASFVSNGGVLKGAFSTNL